ncbi:hypothetical protein BO70DRAFT_15078 [Aspergillus heteromorphus CBS 117.55]|uniref:Uncharacterized protein n=1 Tax=Aspergillus heteromorphus CBS 117.55 TaxID=1448321 RepID=A0A317X6X0_9EURO|nr:uncharacterized protein BO70DRAFT_15078 [Aspergillus heteromorphus CBS 117.55]PWY92618.1 hypothetical protein BO70DRAFT_15078 [Aspergillus heteromorphus CBS 117.55]
MVSFSVGMLHRSSSFFIVSVGFLGGVCMHIRTCQHGPSLHGAYILFLFACFLRFMLVFSSLF